MATEVKQGWRTVCKVHPAADVFPMLPDDKLEAWANDIAANGLQAPIQTRGLEQYKHKAGYEVFLIDGRNRLDAMERFLGWSLVNYGSLYIPPQAYVGTLGKIRHIEHHDVSSHTQMAKDVIALNVRRRHLTKTEQVELIDDALRVAKKSGTDRIKNIRSVTRGKSGKLTGSTKDPHKAAVIEEAEKVGISKPTVEKALASKRGRGLQRRSSQARMQDTSSEFVKKRFQKFLAFWAETQWRLATARMAQCLLGRWELDKDPSKPKKFIAPVSVTYSDGKTVKMVDLFEEWQRVLEKA